MMDIEKLQLSPAYRAVSDDLRKRIVRGEVRPGEALPIEGDLASRYGVHRSTVREGLRQLEQDGLVRREGKKLIVTIPSHNDLASAAERALRMQQVCFGDVWEVASELEPLCARLAAERITADELAALRANLDRTAATLAQGPAGSAALVNSTIEFQTLVAEASHNPALQLARGPVSQLMRAGYAAIAPALPQSGERLLQAHGEVVAALAAGDAERAVSWTRKHMLDYRRGCEFAGLDLSAPIPLNL